MSVLYVLCLGFMSYAYDVNPRFYDYDLCSCPILEIYGHVPVFFSCVYTSCLMFMIYHHVPC